MAKNLVIVESPAKAKTIEKFLGSDYQVESSYGHIADLPSKEIGVDVENGFKPRYEVSADKKALVSKLKTLSKNAEMVWLASDEDREGEAISWHLSEELKLKPEKTKRIVFHEITKTAIQKAIEDAKKNLIKVPILHGTVPHEQYGKFGGGNVFIKPASHGTGVIAGGAMRAVLESAGVHDVLAKSKGSSNPHNVVKATIKALGLLREPIQVAKTRNIKLSKVFNG